MAAATKRRKASPQQADPIDLATAEGRKRAKEVREGDNYSPDDYHDSSKLEAYLKTGELSPVVVGDSPIFFVQETWSSSDTMGVVAILDGVIIPVYGGLDLLAIDPKKIKANKSDTPRGVIVPTERRTEDTKGYKHIALLNGDEDYNEINEQTGIDSQPTISLECLMHFYEDAIKSSVGSKSPEHQLCDLLASGTIQVVDYTSDDTRQYSKPDRAVFNKINKLRQDGKPVTIKMPAPPEPGFSDVGGEWHRAATVLFYDTRTKNSIIIGQDEGTYFGCEIKGHPASIEDAYVALAPEGAHDVAGVVRQGEWFAVPIEEDEVPKMEEAIALSASDITLPIDDPESNQHHISSNDIRVGKDGIIYALDPNVEHSAGEHEAIAGDGWCKFLRNTALRSFSVAGVD